MSFSKAEEREYLTFRVAIASGLFASLGATLGWIVWLTVKVWNRELLTTVIVGAAIGLIVHWCEHYLHVAKHERDVEESEEPEHRGNQSLAALTWATGFAFLGLASEHLVADMAATYLRPFLSSLATLLPAGVILGVSMHRGKSRARSTSDALFDGLVAGAMVTVLTGLISLAGWGSAHWIQLLCWWCLVGLGMQFFMPDEPNSTRFYQPVCGIIAAFVLMVLLSLLPIEGTIFAKGPIGNAAFLAKAMALEVVNSPGLPAQFWLEADKPKLAENPSPKPPPVPLNQPPAQSAPLSPFSTSPLPHESDAVNQLIRDTNALNASSHLRKMENPEKALQNYMQRKATSSGGNASWKLILGELSRGFDSPLVRSWLVLLLFAMGLGLAPIIERALRPDDYPSSTTFRKDVTLALFLVAAIIAACLYARFSPAEHEPPDARHASSEPAWSPESTRTALGLAELNLHCHKNTRF